VNKTCLDCGIIMPATNASRCIECNRKHGRQDAARKGRNSRIYYTADWKRARAIALRAYDHRCAYCGTSDNLHVHHLQSVNEGGSNDVSNLQVLCGSCHGRQHGG
jgi:5-methylcytosine-specific restriction endonuclease McrA